MPENLKAANFGDIYLNLDKNHDINCQLISFDVTKFNEKGNRYQDCVLWDGYDQKKVKIWEGRNGLPLEDKNQNEWLTFSLSARAGTGKWKNNKYLGGFWDSSAAIIDSPPQAQQAPQNAPQSTNRAKPAPQAKKEPDWDAIAEGKVRHGVVCAFIAAGKKPTIEDIEYWVNYIITGKVPDPDLKWEEKDICPHCGKPHPECSCTPAF